MAINHLKKLFLKLTNKYSLTNINKNDIFNLKKYPIYLVSLIVLFITYSLIVNQISSYNKVKQDNFENFIEGKEFSTLTSYFLDNLRSPYKEYSYVIKNNDTIDKILNNFKIKQSDIKLITAELKKRKLSNIYSGRKLSIVLKKGQNNANNVVNILYPINNTLSIEIRKQDKDFLIRENKIKLDKKEVVIKNTIKNNLYSAAIEAGIEPNIIIEFARIYGFEVDFQRDIRKGDWFEIYYEKYLDDNNVVKDTGKIIYASMYVNNKEINLYNFKTKNESGFYDLGGRSIVKSLMKTPINGARLSSSFGNRKHPILGYTKLHAGTDFAAPSGTPIMASGSGTVTRARWCGGGGNCIKIKHNSTYQTVYAHMSKFGRGIKKGAKVKQGQIIGYVGSTGLSTGPHLHYEVIQNGKKINSQKLKLPSGKILTGNQRKYFEVNKIKIDVLKSELISEM